MSRTVFFTAVTLDGYLADDDDSLAWLFVQDHQADGPMSIEDFMAGMGALVMGATTYQWVLDHNERTGDAWIYEQPTFVFTHRGLPLAADNVTLVQGGPEDHIDAIQAAAGDKDVWMVGGGDLAAQFAEANSHITIHAGEAFGLPSIWEALQICGAERLGHGVRIIDDIEMADDGTAHLGRLAAFVRDRRVPLEMCPTSNVNTGVCDTVADHPIGLLRALRFRVTVNTDNRLMSDISMSREFANLHEAFGWGWDDFEWLTINAMKSSFWPFDKRLRIINEQIKPGYAALKAAALGSSLAGS